MRIPKKIWPKYFEKILSGEKKVEVRLADFVCVEGDVLVLQEWDPATQTYTGRSIEKRVTNVFNTKDVKLWSKEEVDAHGLLILSLNERIKED